MLGAPMGRGRARLCRKLSDVRTERAGGRPSVPPLVIAQLPLPIPGTGQPAKPQLVPGLALGQVVDARSGYPRGSSVAIVVVVGMGFLVVGPAGAAQRTDRTCGEPAGPDRNPPDQAHSGRGSVRRRDIPAWRRPEPGSAYRWRRWPPGLLPGPRARASSGTARQPGPLRGANGRPQGAQAVQVGGGRSLFGQHRQPPGDGVRDHAGSRPIRGVRGDHQVLVQLAQALVQRGEGRYVQEGGGRTTTPEQWTVSSTRATSRNIRARKPLPTSTNVVTPGTVAGRNRYSGA